MDAPLNTMDIVWRLGITPTEALTIESVIQHSSVAAAARAHRMRRESFSMRLCYLKRKLHLKSTMHVCLLYDRVRRGASNAEAMEGLR